MMKNKIFTWFLIISVFFIWGIIFYNLFQGQRDESPIISANPSVKQSYFVQIDNSKYIANLNTDLRNPFTEDVEITKVVNQQIISDKPAITPAVIKVPVNWNSITYKGYIQNPGEKITTAILSFNGEEFMIHEGESKHGIQLLKHAIDSVKLKYNQESKFLSIK